MYTFWVDSVPPGLNQRLHHMSRYRIFQRYKQDLGWQVRQAHRGPPFPYARVTCTVVYRHPAHRMDRDNAYSRVKCLVDALQGLLIEADDEEHADVVVRQEQGTKRGVRLEVEEEQKRD